MKILFKPYPKLTKKCHILFERGRNRHNLELYNYNTHKVTALYTFLEINSQVPTDTFNAMSRRIKFVGIFSLLNISRAFVRYYKNGQ